MNFKKIELNFTQIKRQITIELKRNIEYKNLTNKEKLIISQLSSIRIFNSSKNMLYKYCKLNKEIIKIELKNAFDILNNKKNIKLIKKGKIYKIYDYLFYNSIITNLDYKTKINKRINYFNILQKNSKRYKNLLFQLEEIQIQIARIETEKLIENIYSTIKKK